MTVAESGAFVVEVETATPGVFVPVNEMTGHTASKTRDVRTVRVFMRSAPRKTTSNPDRSFTLTGLLDTTDAGQMRIRAQEALGLPVNLRVQPIGPFDDDAGGPNPVRPNGYTVLCTVSSTRHEASADGDYQTWSIEAAPIDDPVIVNSGPITI